jgi:outer membrane protein assembly factor BamB
MRILIRAISPVLVLVLAFGPARADWPGFRGPQGSAVSDEKGLPTKWSGTENLVWKIKLPGPGGSSAITLGDRVFVTCYTGYGIPGNSGGSQDQLRRHVLCLDRKTGRTRWDKVVEAKLPETGYRSFITQHGYASSTPATDGERLYVFFGKSGVLAFDLDGKQLWQTSVGTGTHGWGSGSSPVLYKDLVIINAGVESNALVALNKRTGSEVWKAPGIRRSWSTPLLVDVGGGKQELVISMEGTILGFNPGTGKELWKCEGINDYVCPSVAAKDGVVYAIGGRQAEALAVRAGGRGNVTKTHLVWEKNIGSNVTSPLVYGDHLYWVSDRGMAYCVKAKTGEQVYAERLPGNAQVYASAVAGDGTIYVVTRQKGTFVLPAKPKFEVLAHNTFEGDKSIFNASPAISDGRLYLRSNEFLYCVGKK